MDDGRIQVIIPYADLCDLLQAPLEVQKLRREVRMLSEQITAIRGIQHELMDLVKELKAAIHL